MTDTPKQILLRWIDHVDHLEMDEALGLYAEHATLLPTFSPHSHSGLGQISEYFERLATRQNLRVELHEGSLAESPLNDHVSVLTGLYSFHFEVDGEDLAFPSRFTFIVDVSADRPIVHHHSSQVPRTLS